MKVFRFQGTKNIETKSYFEDIIEMWYEFQNYKDLYATKVIPNSIINTTINKYNDSLSLRDTKTSQIIQEVLNCDCETQAWDAAQRYKLNGVFAIENKMQCISELMDHSVKAELGLSNKYLIQADARLIKDFGKNYGMLVEIEKINNIRKVPKHIVKRKFELFG